MKKIWGYVSAFLAGALAVAILAWKFVGDHYKGHIKFRQSGRGNIQKPSVSLKMDRKSGKNGQISDRKQKRLEKKAARLQKKL